MSATETDDLGPIGDDLEASDSFTGAYGLSIMEVGDELVLLDPLSSKSFRINASGAVIWRAVASGAKFGELCAELGASFSLPAADARAITREFLASLGSRGLVARSPRAEAEVPGPPENSE